MARTSPWMALPKSRKPKEAVSRYTAVHMPMDERTTCAMRASERLRNST